MSKEKPSPESAILFRPMTGTVLAVAAGLSFFVLCMILPLVGRAGSRVEHAGPNRIAFILVLLVTLLLASGAAYSKLGRRKIDQSPLPLFSLGLCAICLITLVVLLLGGLAI